MIHNQRVRRLVLVALFVAAVLVGLWRSDLLHTSHDAQVSDATGAVLDLQGADVSIETPPVAGTSAVGLEVGDVAPDFAFSGFDGSRQRLSDYRGRPVLLNFWASWCEPCRVEMPAIEAAMQAHSADDLAVIAVNNGESAATASRFLAQLKVKLTVFAYDSGGDVGRRYALEGMPTSYFVDAAGVITAVSPGQLSTKLLDADLAATIGH